MSLYLTWAALLLLLAATVGSALFPLGAWNGAINLVIACAKAALVAAIFMRLRSAGALIRLVAASALFMMLLLVGLSAADYATRSKSPAPWSRPATAAPG